jgi:hypothetical protein
MIVKNEPHCCIARRNSVSVRNVSTEPRGIMAFFNHVISRQFLFPHTEAAPNVARLENSLSIFDFFKKFREACAR